MTVVFLSGNRMQGLSSDTKPTTVPTNSTFQETDTGLSFIFNGATYDQTGGGGGGITGLNPNSTILDYSTEIDDYTTPDSATATTPTGVGFTIDDDFTSYTSDGNAAATYPTTASGILRVRAAENDLFIDAQRGSTWDAGLRRDINGSIMVGNQFNIRINQINASTFLFSSACFIGISDTPTGTATTSQDFVGIMFGGDTSQFGFSTRVTDAAGLSRTTAQQALNVATDYWIEIKCDGTTLTATAFSDSAFTNIVGSPVNQAIGTSTDWRFFKVMGDASAGSTQRITATFQKLQITADTNVSGVENSAGQAIDGDTATFWQSEAGVNESIILDMGSVVNAYGLSYFIEKAEITETQFQIIKPVVSIISVADLKAYYKFDESSGSIINQSSEVGSVDEIASSQLVPVGTPNYLQAGIIGTSVGWVNPAQFQASSSTTTDWNFLHQNGATMSIVCWVNLNSFAAFNYFAATQQVSGTQGGILARVNTNGTIAFWIGQTGGDLINETSVAAIPNDSNFHFIAITYSDSTGDLTIRIDNTTETFGGNNLTNTEPAHEFLNLGSDTNTLLFDGDIDEYSVWGRALTLADTDTLYNNGNGQALEDDPARVLRTINVTDLAEGQNFIRFNGVNTRFLTIEGSSGNSLIMAANELAVQLETDPPLTTEHGQFTINGTNENLALNGGDPTSSVIDDPSVNSMTLVNTVTQNDPVTGAGVLWVETVDANNDGIFAKIKVAGAFQVVRIV